MSLTTEICQTRINPRKFSPHDYAQMISSLALKAQKPNKDSAEEQRKILEMARNAHNFYDEESKGYNGEFLSELAGVDPHYHAKLLGYLRGIDSPGE